MKFTNPTAKYHLVVTARCVVCGPLDGTGNPDRLAEGHTQSTGHTTITRGDPTVIVQPPKERTSPAPSRPAATLGPDGEGGASDVRDDL